MSDFVTTLLHCLFVNRIPQNKAMTWKVRGISTLLLTSLETDEETTDEVGSRFSISLSFYFEMKEIFSLSSHFSLNKKNDKLTL